MIPTTTPTPVPTCARCGRPTTVCGGLLVCTRCEDTPDDHWTNGPTDAAVALLALLTSPLCDRMLDPALDLGAWFAEANDLPWSSGERIVIETARAVWNGQGDVRIGDLYAVDSVLRARIVSILDRLWGF